VSPTWYYFPVQSDSLGHFLVYRPNLKQKSDADILRDAKLEAMGLPPQEEAQRNYNSGGNQMATDEVVCILFRHADYDVCWLFLQVMERFKKRMRK
jgi:hypothetical protein